jgi:Tfp pilus assembly protein PilN
MIQFNLLPAVKMEYVKARQTKRMTVLIATLVASASLVILVLLFVGVQIAQKKHSRDLSKDIKTESSKLEDTTDLNKILTIQNQLNSLTGLHDKKPVATRLFNYVKQVTPASVSIATLNVDFDAQTISVTGSADAISSVNKFVDTLKFTTYKMADNTEGSAFSSVVLAGFGKDDKGASYQLTLKYDPKIFDSAGDVTLNVPSSKITTRSQTEKPESLFQPLSNDNEGAQ